MTTSRGSRLLLILVLVLLTLAPRLAPPETVDAATLTFAVTSTADSHDATPGDGLCADAGGHCTLRAATEEANALPAGSTIHITLPTGHYLLTLGELDLISNTVIISGTGAATTVVDAGGHSRVLQVSAGSTVAVLLLSLTGGYLTGNQNGGGILNGGRLLLSGSSIRGNHAGQDGGGIDNLGTVLLTNSALIGNTANDPMIGGSGGGLDNASGTAVLTHSVVISNAAAFGGGLQNWGGSSMTLGNSAIISNTGSFDGGGIFNDTGAMTATNGEITNIGAMTITNSAISGNASAYGGGISNVGTMTLTTSAIVNNTASSYGGGIDALPLSLTVVDHSTLAHNSATQGGGLHINGVMMLTSSAIVSNTATTQGGGLYNEYGKVTLTNSTLSGNAAAQGAGLFLDSFCCSATSTAISFSTISTNTAAALGGGLYIAAGATAMVTGTILAGNTSANCAGTLPTEGQGYNLDSGSSCGLSRPTDLSATNPLLGPLAYNGGPTPTQALPSGSPAIDHGGSSANGCPATDQRGVSRPQGPACDIGAYERVP